MGMWQNGYASVCKTVGEKPNAGSSPVIPSGINKTISTIFDNMLLKFDFNIEKC